MLAPLFSVSPSGVVGASAFLAGLGAACVSDVRARRIPNATVLALATAGVAFSLLTAGVARGSVASVSGLLTGLALWFPLFALGAMGAGDVKLFAASAAWLGPERALMGSLYAALAGGVLAVAWLVRTNGVGLTAARLGNGGVAPIRPRLDPRSARTIPYGVALAIGAACAAWFPRLVGGG
jgi:prepilin peptidase CpaA